MHTMAVDAQGVMRMREVDGIALAPKAKIQMKPGTGMHLMLIGLKAPLKAGTTFPMTLRVRARRRVDVTVERAGAQAGTADEMHMH